MSKAIEYVPVDSGVFRMWASAAQEAQQCGDSLALEFKCGGAQAASTLNLKLRAAFNREWIRGFWAGCACAASLAIACACWLLAMRG